MYICSLLLLTTLMGPRLSWRDALANKLEAAYRAGGMALPVSRAALYSPVIATMSSGGIAALEVMNVHWDALHQRSVILLERKGAHPLVAQSSERLPNRSEGHALVIQPPAPLIVKAGESCVAALSDGKLLMKFETKALNSARMGQTVRVEMRDERRKILRAVVVGRGQVEVLP